MKKERPPEQFHATMKRLIEVLIDEGKIRVGNEPSQIARLFNLSDGVIGNWTTRGISRGGLLQAQTIFNISPAYLTKGIMPIFVGQKIASNLEFTDQELHFLSLFRRLPSNQARNVEVAALEARVNDQPNSTGHTPARKSRKAA